MFEPIRNQLRSLAIPRSLIRWLPGSSRSFGPPRRLGPICTAVPEGGGSWSEVEPEGAIPPPRPLVHGPCTEFLANFRSRAPAGRVFTLPQARLLGNEGFIITSTDRFVRDASFAFEPDASLPADYVLFKRKFPRPTHCLKGTCVSLATDYAAGSFGHFLHDGYARMHLLAKARIDWSKVDWVYCPHPSGKAVEALFGLLPVPRERIIGQNTMPGHDYEAERLIGTSFPGIPGSITPGVAGFLQEIGSRWRRPDGRRERVFLTRDGYRRNFAESAEINVVLHEFGFRIVDPAFVSDTLELCANAEIIAGVGGSNMANVAFAPTGCRILLIFPSDSPPMPYNTTLATSGGRSLHIIQGQPLPGESRDYQAAFFLEAERLRHCLHEVLVSRADGS